MVRRNGNNIINLVSSDRIFPAIIKNSTIMLLTLFSIVITVTIKPGIIIAQTDVFDPLATPQEDPLLPPINVPRELSSLEKNRVQNAIIEIDQEAKYQLAQRNLDAAFKLWFRELRLQRAIGLTEEITDLGRIGAIAWQENRGSELRIIARRLAVIEQEITTTEKPNFSLLTNLGKAYQEIRYLDRSVKIYEQILTQIQPQNNLTLEEKILSVLGELYLAKFDYAQAGIVYEQLLALSNQEVKIPTLEQNDQLQIYLLKLVDIYDSSNQLEKAIKIKEQLVEKYIEQEQPEKIASLKISLAADYQKINELELSEESYQEAFILAEYLQQVALANEALEKLAIFYQDNNKLNLATQTYLQLFAIQEQASNAYALLNICDRLGELYLLQNEREQALNYYVQGLEYAQLLNYLTEYFQTKINELSQ